MLILNQCGTQSDRKLSEPSDTFLRDPLQVSSWVLCHFGTVPVIFINNFTIVLMKFSFSQLRLLHADAAGVSLPGRGGQAEADAVPQEGQVILSSHWSTLLILSSH